MKTITAVLALVAVSLLALGSVWAEPPDSLIITASSEYGNPVLMAFGHQKAGRFVEDRYLALEMGTSQTVRLLWRPIYLVIAIITGDSTDKPQGILYRPPVSGQDTLTVSIYGSLVFAFGDQSEAPEFGPTSAPKPAVKEPPPELPVAPEIVATPPDSLVGAVIEPARPPAKYKKQVPKRGFGKKDPWELASWDSFSVVQQDSILRAYGKCLLTVKNETSDIFKFRVGHLFWEEQNSLLQDQSGIMYIDADEHHELHRYMWSNGVLAGSMREDMYSFYVPRGVARHAVTFGGPQTGRVVNQCGTEIKFTTPMVTKPVLALPGSYRDNVQTPPGRQLFVVYFGPDFRRYAEIYFRIDDKPADNQVQVVEEVEDKRVVRIKRVDFIATIDPSDLANARTLPSYKPALE